jgi:hypothetical protein
MVKILPSKAGARQARPEKSASTAGAAAGYAVTRATLKPS